MRALRLEGDAYAQGFQHGRQVLRLKEALLRSMNARLEKMRAGPARDVPARIEEVKDAWAVHAPALLEMMKGLAAGLGVAEDDLFSYHLASYLEDARVGEKEGCSVWAASPPKTKDGEVILAKNRDYWVDHRPLQSVAYVTPDSGYRYLTLTSAGSPGVYSSGINEVGLAVADTHVVSRDIGPGVPRYGLMMMLLERCDTVSSARDYLASVPHMGGGNVVVADAAGGLLLCESAWSNPVCVTSEDGFVVATNHFVSDALRETWVETDEGALRGNSLARRAYLEERLTEASGNVDVRWAHDVMSYRDGPGNSVCRDESMEKGIATISLSVYLPLSREAFVWNGSPRDVGSERFSM